MQVTRQNEKKGIRRSKKKKQRKLEKMDKKKRKENTKESLRIWEILTKKKRNGYCSIVRRAFESARRRAIAIKNVRVWVYFCLCLRHEGQGLCMRVALSKYQFETAVAIGMRHAFHRPLRPAFHFYLYLPGRFCRPPVTRLVSSRSSGTWQKGVGSSATSRFLDILRHFVSYPRGGGVGASCGISDLIRLL